MGLLVIDFVSLADLKVERPSIDHETHAPVRCNWYMNAVAAPERHVAVEMRVNATTGQQLGGHRTNNCATRRIMLANQAVHNRNRHLCQVVPASFLGDFELVHRSITEDQHHRLRLFVDLVIVLPMDVGEPGFQIETEHSVD